MSFTLSRRALLKGMGQAAAVSIALPRLEAMAQASAPPKRLVVFHFANGAPMGLNGGADRWTPAGATVGPTPCLEGLTLGGTSWHSRVNVVTGLSTASLTEGEGGNPHVAPTLCAPTGLKPTRSASGAPAGPGGPSFDQVAARALGTPALVLATRARNESLEGLFSYAGADNPVAAAVDPQAVFCSLFPGACQTVGPDPIAPRRSVLDYVGGQVTALQRRLGAGDRLRLQAHLDAVRALEASLQQRAPAAGCTTPVRPVQPRAWWLDDAHLPEHADVMLELMTMALACDLTQVASFSITPGGGGPTFPFLRRASGAAVEKNDHDASHLFPTEYPNGPPDTDPLETYTLITRWKVQAFASLLRRLDAVGEGAGTLLDHSAVVAYSEMSNGAGHFVRSLPVLAAGGLGGMATGRHLTFPCRRAPGASMAWCVNDASVVDRPLADLWLTLLRAVGVQAEAFGNSTGTLPGLWV